MLSAKIGIELVPNNEKVKELFRDLSAFVVTESGQIVNRLVSQMQRMEQLLAQAGQGEKAKRKTDDDEDLNRKKKKNDDEVGLKKSAVQALAAEDEKLAATRKRLESQSEEQTKSDLTRLTAESKKARAAMADDVSKEDRAILAERKRAADEEIRLIKTVQAEQGKPPKKAPIPDHKAEYQSAEAALKAHETRLEDVRDEYRGTSKRKQKKLDEELEHDLKHLEEENKSIRAAMASDVSEEARKELAEKKKETEQEIALLKQVQHENQEANKPKGHSEGGHGGGEGGHGGGLSGGANLAGGLMVAEQGVEFVEKFMEKGKQAMEVTEGLEQGLARAGVAEKDMERAVEQVGDASKETADKFALQKIDVDGLTASFLKAGGHTENLKQTQGDIIALAKSAGMSYDQAAKALAGATDPEIEKALARQGIGFDKNASAADRVRIVHEKLAPMEAQMAKQAEGPLGQMERAKNAMADLQRDVGTALMGIIGPFLPMITQIVEKIGALLQSILPPLKKIIEAAIMPLIEILKSVIDPIIMLFQKLLPPIQAILGKLLGVVGKLLTSVVGSIMKGVGPLLTTIVNLVSRVFDAISPLIDTILQLVDALLPLVAGPAIMELLNTVVTSLAGPLADIIGLVAGLATNLLQALLPVITPLIGIVAQLASMLLGALGDALSFIIGIIAKLVEGALKIWVGALNWVIDAVKYVVEWLKQLWLATEPVRAQIMEKLQPALDWLAKAWKSISSAISDVASAIMGWFKKAWDWIIGAIKTVGGWIEWVVGWYNKIYDWIFKVIGIVARWGAGLLGMGGIFDKVVGWIKGMVDGVKGAITAVGKFLGLVSENTDKAIAPKPQAAQPTTPAEPAKEPESTAPVSLAGAAGVTGKDADRADKDAKKTAKDRLAALKEAYDKEIARLQEKLDEENSRIQTDLLNKKITQEEADKQSADAQLVFDTGSLAAAEKYRQKVHQIKVAILKDNAAIAKAEYDEEKATREKAYSEAMDDLEDRIVNEGISDTKAKRLRQAEQLKFYNDDLELQKKHGQDTLALEKQIRDLKRGMHADDLKAESDFRKQMKAEADAAEKARIDAIRDELERRLEQEDFGYKAETEKAEEAYETQKDLAGDNAELLREVEEAHRHNTETLERAHLARLAQIRSEYYDKQAQEATDFANKLYDITVGAEDAIRKAKDKDLKAEDLAYKDAVDKELHQSLAGAKDKFKAEAEQKDKLVELSREHAQKRQEIEDKYRQQEEEKGAKANIRQLVLEKTGLDRGIKQLLAAKIIEVGIHLWAETSKTATAETGVLARIGMMAVEAWNSIKAAGAAMVHAVAELISWQASLGWWNVLLVPGEIAAMYGMYRGAAELFSGTDVFKFADGVVLGGPAFAPVAGGLGIAGEAGPEIVAPLSKLPSLLGLDRDRGGSALASAVQALHGEVRGMKEEFARHKTIILDPHGVKLSIDHDTKIRNSSKP